MAVQGWQLVSGQSQHSCIAQGCFIYCVHMVYMCIGLTPAAVCIGGVGHSSRFVVGCCRRAARLCSAQAMCAWARYPSDPCKSCAAFIALTACTCVFGLCHTGTSTVYLRTLLQDVCPVHGRFSYFAWHQAIKWPPTLASSLSISAAGFCKA